MSGTNGFDDWAPDLWRKLERRRRLVRWGRRIGAGALAASLIAAAVTGVVLSRPGGPWANADTTDTSDAVGPAVSASGSPTPRPTASDPFRGTVAEKYPSGAAGIVPPAATAVGTYSAAQVAAMYSLTKAFLVAANLDPRVHAGDLDPALAILAPHDQDAIRADLVDDPGGVINFASRFAAGVTQAYPAIRVKGTMTARVTPEGLLEIRTNYVFAFPLRSSGTDEVVILHRLNSFDYHQAGTVAATSAGVWLQHGEVTTFFEACDASNRGELAPETDTVDDPPPDPRDPTYRQRFDPSAPMAHHACAGASSPSPTASPTPGRLA